MNSAEYHAWNPNIDWDKLVNFREYYWLPTGPEPISVFGNSRNITSTWNVVSVSDGESPAFVFNGNLEKNRTIELFKGQTYTFNVSTPDIKFSIRTSRSVDADTLYEDENLSANEINEEGTFTFTILDAPNRLYYVYSNNVENGGIIRISDVHEATEIDVEAEIIGKEKYPIAGGYELQNGMKPPICWRSYIAKYAEDYWYVEGVGDKIELVKYSIQR